MDALADARAFARTCLRATGLALGRAGPALSRPKTPRNAVLSVWHPPFRRARPLKWRTASAILKPLVREHRAHTAFMSTGHPAMHEVQYLGIGVALVTRP
jgi:hypothetical protein